MTFWTVAVIGNPNAGKTTLFNQLTGLRQEVGNWPGVTVEKKSGRVAHGEDTIELVPGERAVVRGLRAGARAYRAKLLAMGLLPGTVIEVVRMAPLGDPVELRVRGYQLTLRRAEAEILALDEVAP